MVKAMAEQLAAAHAEIKHLRATLEERDNTISQLRQEVQELSQTVGLQAQTLREREAALVAAVRVRAAGGEPAQAPRDAQDPGGVRTAGEGAAGRFTGAARGEGVWVGRRHAPHSQHGEGPQAWVWFLRILRRRWDRVVAERGRDAARRGAAGRGGCEQRG